MRQNPLGAPGAAVPDRFGQLPAVLALGRAEQPLQIETRLAPRLRTPEQLTHPPLQLRQRLTPPGQPCRLQHQTHPEPKPQIATIKPSRWEMATALQDGKLKLNCSIRRIEPRRLESGAIGRPPQVMRSIRAI